MTTSLSNRIVKSHDDIVDHCRFASNKLVNQTWKMRRALSRDLLIPRHRPAQARPVCRAHIRDYKISCRGA
jgi:uncharacterized membrane-anchored protein YhcB (DUF1043 family)